MSTSELNIIVVGAGIAGLGAAIVLSRAGHNVTIIEKSHFKEEVGFHIIMGWNATRVLGSLDFDFEKARGSDSECIGTFNGATLEAGPSFSTTTPGADNSQTRTFYRPDLHNELKRLALYPGPGKKVPKLMLGRKVISVCIDTASAILENSEIIAGDLIIGADGERSIVKRCFGESNTLKKAKYRIFRTLVPTESILEDAETRSMLDLTRRSFATFLEGNKTMFWFEGRDGLLQDLEAGYVPGEIEGPPETDPKRAKAKMLEKFKDYHPKIVASLQKAERVSEWEINYFPRPPSRIFRGKALLIGDAVHSMFPTTGQGGSQTLEDIGALSLLFSTNSSTSLPSPYPLTSPAQMHQRPNLFSKIRKERMGLVMGMSGCVFGREAEFVKKKPWLKTGIESGEEHTRILYG
ncbi:uncharacterized protein PAC_06291 [Phialocephala subalpina]|uniref:FAD-binding domain-containing protein n=1 Tax=Phialocephala subalpina TaxID=576137 RepID=A0A1L7WUJ9_9HELO|nr:uncharacterized protein PAC_06291 [Phialocephala subalpina]